MLNELIEIMEKCYLQVDRIYLSPTCGADLDIRLPIGKGQIERSPHGQGGSKKSAPQPPPDHLSH